MSTAEAELALVLKARNLASGSLDEIRGSLDKVGKSATESGGHFGALGRIFDSIPFGGIAHGLLDIVLQSKPVQEWLAKVGAVIGEKLAPVIARVSAFIDTKLLPAISSIVGWLADHLGPVISNTIIPALSTLLGWIGDVATALWGNGKGPLAIAVDLIGKALGFLNDHVIQPIIGAIAALIQGVRDAIDLLGKLGQAADRGQQGISTYLEQTGGGIPGNAAGGWVGLNGPEIRRLGERGPEYVVPNQRLGGGSSDYELVPVARKDLARMVDEQLYFTLRRAAPTSGRV